jgi:hypothetical protein
VRLGSWLLYWVLWKHPIELGAWVSRYSGKCVGGPYDTQFVTHDKSAWPLYKAALSTHRDLEIAQKVMPDMYLPNLIAGRYEWREYFWRWIPVK